MAVANTEVTQNINYLSILTESILHKVKTTLKLDEPHMLRVVKRNKKLGNGDLTLIQHGAQSDAFSELPCMRVAVTSRDDVSITDVKYDLSGTVAIKLNRKEVFSAMLNEVLSRRTEFGKFTYSAEKAAIVNASFLHSLQADFPGEVTVCHMRSLLLSQHIFALLQISGYEVKHIHYCNIPDQFKRLYTMLGIRLQHCDASSSQYVSTVDKLRHSLKTKAYENELRNGNSEKLKKHSCIKSEQVEQCDSQSQSYVKPQSVFNDDNRKRLLNAEFEKLTLDKDIHDFKSNCKDTDSSCDEDDEESLLDLKGFIKEKLLPTGKEGYDSNISLADFSEETERYRQICTLEHNIKNILPNIPDLCVHVMPYEQMFSQQQVDIGWKMLSESARNIHQIHIPGGPISPRKSSQTDLLPLAEAFLCLRREQMREAFRAKYGDQVQGEGWESTIEALTIAAVKFEFLTTNNRSPLKLDVSENFTGLTDTKGGVFVMYNCARLSTLFYKFDNAVERGIYPPLPPADKIDFSCLREEEEWELLFNYILPYPNVIASCVAALPSRKPRSQIHAHKVCQFLLDLSRDFSSYYNRVHVLGEPREHLLQTMYARIHLLKAIEQVMHNALSLLDIQPLPQL